jgi:hypothetical protein
MNRYRLSADSDRWWHPTAIAGTVGAAAVGAILLVPLMGAQASQLQAPTHHPGPVTLVDRPCYLARAGWHARTGWQQPVCTTEIRGAGDGFTSGSHRVLPRYLP